MRVIIKYPNSEPFDAYIANDLRTLQAIVGGYIETVTFAEDACIIVNEEGRVLGMPYNLTFCNVDLYGTLIVCGVKGDDFCGLDVMEAEVIKRWMGEYKNAEM